MNTKLLIMLITASCVVSCNDKVFVKPFDVKPESEVLNYTGGIARFCAEDVFDVAFVTAYAWSGGRGMPISDQGMQFSLSSDYPVNHIGGSLCDINLDMSDGYNFTVSSGYSLCADTIYMNIELYGKYDMAECNLCILPQPGFGHGQISYRLNSWGMAERSDTIMIAQIGGASDNDVELTLRKKGDIAAYRTGRFDPRDKRLSDNIFGHKEFTVEEVYYDQSMWSPELSGDMIAYNSDVQRLDRDPLTFDKDLKVKVGAREWAKVRMIVKYEEYGIEYSLPALSPDKEAIDDRIIYGTYRINVPLSYTIEIETGKIRP